MCNGMDTFGFSALHTGVQDRDGYYYYKDGEKEIYFLSSTDTSNEVICFHLPDDENDVSIEYLSKLGKSAFPIRCINEQALLKIERERAERRKREITEELERDEKEQNKGRLTNIFWGIFFTPLSIVAYCYLLPDNFVGLILVILICLKRDVFTIKLSSKDDFRLYKFTAGDIKVDITRNYHFGETYDWFDDFGL